VKIISDSELAGGYQAFSSETTDAGHDMRFASLRLDETATPALGQHTA